MGAKYVTGISYNTFKMIFLRASSACGDYGLKGYLVHTYAFVVAILFSVAVIGLVPEKKCFLTKYGQNTLTIYIAQAVVTLSFHYLMKKGIFAPLGMKTYLVAAALSVFCVAFFGSDFVGQRFSHLVSWVYDKVTGEKKTSDGSRTMERNFPDGPEKTLYHKTQCK